MLGERNGDDPIEPMISTLEVPGLEVVGQMGVAIARLRRLFRGEVPPARRRWRAVLGVIYGGRGSSCTILQII